MIRLERLFTGFVGMMMFVAGMAKFFEPFKTNFQVQITNSELPLPALTKWAGQFGEIAVGLALLSVLYFGSKWSTNKTTIVFFLANMATIVILLVAIFVHIHPAVPAEVLPMGSKPPTLALMLLGMIAINLFLYKKRVYN